jgi:hypothetical protein
VIARRRTRDHDGFGETAGGAVLGFVRQTLGLPFPQGVSASHEPGRARRTGGLAFQEREPRRINVDPLARIGLVVALHGPFQACLDCLLNLGSALETIRQGLDVRGPVTRGKCLPGRVSARHKASDG